MASMLLDCEKMGRQSICDYLIYFYLMEYQRAYDSQNAANFSNCHIILNMSGITYSTFERDFRLEGKLGKGNYATVTKVQHLIDHRTYAHKCIELTSLEEYSQAFNEIETNRCIDDQRIVKINFYYTRQNKKTQKYELGIIMELCNSTLADAIKHRKRKNDFFSRGDLKEFLTTMLPFFAKMQRKGYLHRDIKPDNILLVKNSFNKTVFKVSDFGFSIKVNAYSTLNVAGTMEYVSPKLLVKFKDNKLLVPGHTFKDDVYSFGKTLYEFMTLDVSAPVDQKRLVQAGSRYGNEYCGLLMLMLKESEVERPDFIYLQSFAAKEGLIVDEDSDAARGNYLSISTVNGASSKQRMLSLSNVGRKGRSKEKPVNDFTKTRKKQYDLDSEPTKLQQNTSRSNQKLSKVEEVVKRKVINYGENIHSLALFESCLFIGSEGKIGVMLLANQKILKIKLESGYQFATVTFIKIDPMKRFIFFATFDNKLFTIQFTEIKRAIVHHNDSFKKKSEVQISISQLKHKALQTTSPISCFDCHYLDDSKEPIFVIGHSNGEVTCINAQRKITQGKFSTSPITHIAIHKGSIFSSSADGVFRKEMSLNSTLWVKNEEQADRKACFLMQQRSGVYNYHAMLVFFQIIDTCKSNESIKKDANKLLAIVISYDGFAHIISRSFKVVKMVMISEANILAAHLTNSPLSELGCKAHLVDTDGDIYNEQGKLIDKSQQKKVSCVAVQPGYLYLGGFCKTLTVVSIAEAVTIE